MPVQSPVTDYLRTLRTTVRRRLFAYGLFAVLAGGLVAFLTILVLDWLLWLPPALRVVGAVLFVAGSLAATRHWVVQPLRVRICPDELAAHIERRFRVLQDQLSSTVNFLEHPAGGSSSMMQRVIADTERMLQDLPLATALSVRPLALRGAACAAACVVLMGVLALAPAWAHTGVVRYLQPWSDTQWPRTVAIRPLTADQIVPLGESAVVRMTLERGLYDDLRAVVYLREPDGRTQALALHKDPDDTFSTTVDAITEDLTYWFEAGDDDTAARPSVIRVVRRPEVVEALASVEPPPYALGRPTKVVDPHDGPVAAPIGGAVTLSLRTSKPLPADSSEGGIGLRGPSEEWFPLQVDPHDARLLSARLEITADITLRPELRDEHGFSNRGSAAYDIRALPDRPPTATTLEPPSVTELSPQGSLRVVVRAEDDFGLASLELHAEGFADGRSVVVPLTEHLQTTHETEGYEALAAYAWDFAALGVAPGDTISCEAAAVDNRSTAAGGPQMGRSAPFRVKVISQAEFEVRLREELIALEARLRQVVLDESALRDRTDALASNAETNAALSETDRDTANQLSGTQSRLAQQVRELSGRLRDLVARMQRNNAGDEQSRTALAGSGDTLRRVATAILGEAANRLVRVAERSASDTSAQALQSVTGLQQEALDRLNEVLRTMSQWGAFQGLVARTRDLHDRQTALRTQTAELGPTLLGKPVESLSPTEAVALKRLERQQDQLADDVERHLTTMEQLAGATRDKDSSGAEAIDDSLRVGRAQELAKRVRQAADAIRSNRTAAASLDQKTAAETLRKMIATLREREERELAQLRKRLERAEDEVAVLLEQQLGLRTATHEATLVDAADSAYADWETGQRTLARNAKMLADDLAEVPRAAGAATHVRQSAEPMGKAEGQLRARRAGLAVEHQDDALKRLQDALTELENMARDSAEDALRRTISHIHDELEAILNGQQAINAAIEKLRAALDETARLGRLEAREASKLAREQSEVRDMVAQLAPELQKVPVYDWALQRVAKWMDQSRAQLDQRTIDDELTTTTERIVRELEKLITALVETQALPQIREFEEADASSGQDGEASSNVVVPTVAELLVLKAMQADINERTRTLNADFDPQSADEKSLRRLTVLGDDQNEVRRLTELVTERAQGKLQQ